MAVIHKGVRGPYKKKKPPTQIALRRTEEELQDEILTPEVEAVILRAVRLGNYIEVSAGMAGVTKSIFLRWMRQGATDTAGKFYEFYRNMNQALAESEIASLATIKKASLTQWQAAAWMLERRWASRWGRNTVEVTGAGGGPISHEHVAIVNMIGKIYGQDGQTLKESVEEDSD